MKRAVYAGTFDPPTNGHLFMIREGARLFDELVVAIGINPDKRATFTLDHRLALLRAVTADLPNVRVDSFENQFLVQYAVATGADYMLRGIRNADDFEEVGNVVLATNGGVEHPSFARLARAPICAHTTFIYVARGRWASYGRRRSFVPWEQLREDHRGRSGTGPA